MNVFLHARGNKSMNPLTLVSAAANVGSGDVAGDIFQKVDDGFVKLRDNLARRLGFFPCIGPRDRVRRDDETQCFGADTRAIGDDEIAKREQRFVFLPHRDVQKGVGANHEKETIAVAVVNVPEVTHGIHGIVELCAAEILACFGQRRHEMRMLGASERDHRKAVRERREMLLQLVRRTARGDEVELVEIEASVGGARNGKMAVVDGIERTAENRNTARMMFCGGAVRLRGGQ